SLRDVVLAKLKGAPRITVNPEKEVLPQELTELVDACLRLKPSLRPASARAVANGLREAEMVLFAVGPIRLGDDGTPVRESSGVEPAEAGPPPDLEATVPFPAVEAAPERSGPVVRGLAVAAAMLFAA